MIKDDGYKWHFLERQKGSMKQGREDSAFDHFTDSEIHSLVREYIQNSMDARPEGSKETVIVEFSFGELEVEEYPNLIGALVSRMLACSEKCQSLPNAKDIYKKKYHFLKDRENGRIGYLKVSDFNTTGMEYIDDEDIPSAFDSCLHNSSASYKPNSHAGGSHGQGKVVGFVNSPINAVYYSTMTLSEKKWGEGVVRLCDHKMTDSEGNIKHYQADAFFNKSLSPDADGDIPTPFNERLSPGTDAYVLGMEGNAEIIANIKMEVLRSFFKAIHEEKLLVVVCGERIDKKSLPEMMLKYYPNDKYGAFDLVKTKHPELYFNPRPYYFEIAAVETKDDNHILLTTEDFPDENFENLGRACFYVWKDESIQSAKSRDTIIYMRDTLMAIEVNRYNSSKGYYGIFVCDGEGSDLLRMMENVTHDKWSEKELRDIDPVDEARAKKAKKEAKRFIDKCLERIFPEVHDKERDILSLRGRRLGAFGNNKTEEDSFWPSTNITEGVSKTKIGESDFTILETRGGGKKKGKRGIGTKITPEPPVDIPVPSVDPPTPPEPPVDPPTPPVPPVDPPTPPEPPVDPPTPPVIPPEKPQDGEIESGEGNDEGNEFEDKPKGSHMKEIRLDGRNKKVKPLHDGEYACELLLRVPNNYVGCKLVIEVQGVRGTMPLELKRVSVGTINIAAPNEIVGFDLSKDTINSIKFTPKENVRNFGLVIKAYGS